MGLIDEIRGEGKVIHGFVSDSYNNCGRLNSCMSEFLSDRGVEHDFVRYGGSVSFEGSSAPHEFIVISSGEIAAVSGPVIVDVAVDQFCDSVCSREEELDVSFGSRGSLPNVVIASEDEDFSEPSVPVDVFSVYDWS